MTELLPAVPPLEAAPELPPMSEPGPRPGDSVFEQPAHATPTIKNGAMERQGDGLLLDVVPILLATSRRVPGFRRLAREAVSLC